MRTSSITTSRGPVEYLDAGDGEAVLCLHGAMGGCDQSELLSRIIGETHYRYLSLSRPGYLGTPLESGRTPEEQADLFDEFLDVLDVPQVIVFAISGGGPSAIHFALRHPGRCRALVLASTTGGPTAHKIPLSFHMMTVLAKLPPFVRMMKRKTANDLRANLQRSVSDPVLLDRTLANAEVMALYRELAVGMFERMAERIAGTRNDIEVSQTRAYPLKDIAVPTLVIHGTKDPMVPFEQHGKRLAEEIPEAQLLAVEGGEHVTIFTHRAEVRARVAAFLYQLDSAMVPEAHPVH